MTAWLTRIKRTGDRLRRKFGPLITPAARLLGGDTAGLAAKTAYHLALSILPLFIFTFALLRGLRLPTSGPAMTVLLPDSVRALLEETLTTSPLAGEITWIGLLVTVWNGSAAVWALMVGIYRAMTEKKRQPAAVRPAHFIAVYGGVGGGAGTVPQSAGLWRKPHRARAS